MADIPLFADRVIWQRARWVAGVAIGIVVVAFGISRSGIFPRLTVLLDNVHWTTAYISGAWLAWMGFRSAAPVDRAARRWFAWALSAYAFGQVLWDVQVAVGWNPFPGPSDLFYSCLGPGCAMGLWSSLRSRMSPGRLRTVALDAGALAVAVLALILALYLPKRAGADVLSLIVLVSYPVTLLGALCLGLILVFSLQPKADRSWLVFLGALLADGFLWMRWNSLTLDNALQDGTWFNLGFSPAAVVLGLGAMGWRTEDSANPKWKRFCEMALRLLPLLLVVIAATSLVLVWTLPGVPVAARYAVGLGVVVVVVLAVLRQSMQLSERDRMTKAELRVRETEGRFRTLFETAHDAIFIMTDREFIDCNASTLRMFGCTRAQIIGHSPVEFSPELQPDGKRSDQKVPEKIAAAMQGRPQIFEWKHLRFDGTAFDAEVSLNHIEVDGRSLLQAIVRDISERKQAEARLRDSEERYRLIVETAWEGIWMIDAGARTSFVNPRMAQMLGYTVEEMLGRTLTDFMDDESRASAEYNIERRKQGITEQHDFRFLRKDATALWATLATGPILDSNGNYAGALAMITDITERKRIEEALRRSESRFRRIMDSNMIGMFFCNTAGLITAANDAFLKMVGYTREDFDAGRVNWSKMTPPEYVPLDQRAIEELAAKGVCTPWEKEYFRKDGSRVAVYVGVATFEGRTDEGVAFVMDISERKRAEQALRESEAGFRRLVENAPEAVVLLDLATGKFSMVNPAAEMLFKLTAAELCHLGPAQLSPPFQPDGQPTFEKAQGYVAQALAGDNPVFEWMHRDSQGCDLACEVRLLRIKINERDFVRGSITELRKRNEAEVAIRESEEKFHAVFAQSPLAIVLTTLPEGLVADANTAAELLLGRKLAEVRGLTTVQMNVWADPMERDRYLQLLQRDGAVNDFEAKMRRPDDSHLVVLYNGRVVRIGGRSYVLNSMLDITGRKLAEEAVRQNREQFIDLFDNAPIGYHEVDAEGRITRMNQTELRMLDYTAEELLGQSAWKITADETVFREAMLAKLSGTQSETHVQERRFRRKDGSVFHVLIEDRILRNSAGLITGIRSVVQDITERKQAEEEAQHLANFPELNPNPVLEFTADGHLVYHNPAALGMAEKVGFSNLADLLPPTVRKIVAECLATGQPLLRLETRHMQSTLSWSFYPINAQQVVHCYVGDITKRIQLEEQFRQAQKMEAIGQLSGGVAHDFNNLLTVILGNLGLLQSAEHLAPEAVEPLQAIAHAANRAANLTRQLLAFSRQQVMQQQDLDLNVVVGHISKMLRRVIGETVKIRLDYALQVLSIHADPGMLEQVILNLSINARDAMPQGGQLNLRTAAVDISAEEARLMVSARPGSFALLAVSDTGTGIAPENMKRVFEPFFTTKEVGKGTGLGLASVYGIAQQHDGWVTVESELNRGTTFTVYLPLLAAPLTTSSQPPQPEKIPRGTETILLVEDDLAVQMVTKITLTRLGYQVLVASNGHQALSLWHERKKEIKLVLTDMIMPEGLNGKDIALRFKKDLPGIRIIFMSGYSADIAGTDFSPAEGDYFIGKPFELHVLAALIRKSLDTVRRG